MERALNPHALTGDPAVGDTTHDDYQSWREYLRSLTRRDAVQWESVPLLDDLRSPRGRHARRRRTIVIGLAGVTGVGLLGAVVGVVPGFVAVLMTLLLGGYVSAMFLQMRQWEAKRRPTAATADVPHDVRTNPFQVRDGVRVVSSDSDSGSQWAPQESTLPIYATKSKATKIPRRIDLTHQGWTGADMVEQARVQQSPHLQSQFDREFAALEPEVDEQVAELANYRDEYYRRAVNE